LEGRRVVSYNGFGRTIGKEIGRGATATIYEVQGCPKLAVKLFNDAFRKDHGVSAQEKIAALRAQCELGSRDEKWGAIAFPRTTIYSPSGEWLGFSMNRYTGQSLNRLMNPVLLKRHFPKISRFHQIKVLSELARQVGALHTQEIFVGDFNENNFLVLQNNIFEDEAWQGDPLTADVQNGSSNEVVAIIDVDGFQVQGTDGLLHRCSFVRPEYIPPEIYATTNRAPILSKSSDEFSFAILAFRTFIHGRHPYDQVGGSSPAENVQAGRFPYGMGGAPPGMQGAIPDGPWYIIWSHLPYKIKNAFIKTFKDGANKPAQRTSMEEWLDLLNTYNRDMQKGRHETLVAPKEIKPSGYRGKT
jgi:DNA-binding helix-hairpin-helix protein with protein kinase domain